MVIAIETALLWEAEQAGPSSGPADLSGTSFFYPGPKQIPMTHRVIKSVGGVGVSPMVQWTLPFLAQAAVLPIAGKPVDIFCFRVRTDKQHHPLAPSQQNRTFPHIAIGTNYPAQKRVQVTPVPQIIRGVQKRSSTFFSLSGAHQKQPAVLFAPDKRVTEIGGRISSDRRETSQLQARRRLADNWSIQFRPGSEIIVASGQTYRLWAGRGVESSWYPAVVDDTSRPTSEFIRPVRRWSQGDRIIFPMDQIRTSRMAPVESPPKRPIRI